MNGVKNRPVGRNLKKQWNFFFHVRVTNSKLKNKKIHFKLLTRWVHFFFSLSSYEREIDKWKKFLKYYSLNVREPLEIDTTL